MRGKRSEEHQRFEQLRSVPLLSRCSDEELRRIDALGTDLRIGAGQRLMREDASAFEAVVILEGTVEVSKDGQKVAELGPGAVVGEVALIEGGKRNATVTTSTPIRALVLNSAEFDSLGHELPAIRDALVELARSRSAEVVPAE